jgi:hypothetical protein
VPPQAGAEAAAPQVAQHGAQLHQAGREPFPEAHAALGNEQSSARDVSAQEKLERADSWSDGAVHSWAEPARCESVSASTDSQCASGSSSSSSTGTIGHSSQQEGTSTDMLDVCPLGIPNVVPPDAAPKTPLAPQVRSTAAVKSDSAPQGQSKHKVPEQQAQHSTLPFMDLSSVALPAESTFWMERTLQAEESLEVQVSATAYAVRGTPHSGTQASSACQRACKTQQGSQAQAKDALDRSSAAGRPADRPPPAHGKGATGSQSGPAAPRPPSCIDVLEARERQMMRRQRCAQGSVRCCTPLTQAAADAAAPKVAGAQRCRIPSGRTIAKRIGNFLVASTLQIAPATRLESQRARLEGASPEVRGVRSRTAPASVRPGTPAWLNTWPYTDSLPQDDSAFTPSCRPLTSPLAPWQQSFGIPSPRAAQPPPCNLAQPKKARKFISPPRSPLNRSCSPAKPAKPWARRIVLAESAHCSRAASARRPGSGHGNLPCAEHASCTSHSGLRSASGSCSDDEMGRACSFAGGAMHLGAGLAEAVQAAPSCPWVDVGGFHSTGSEQEDAKDAVFRADAGDALAQATEAATSQKARDASGHLHRRNGESR